MAAKKKTPPTQAPAQMTKKAPRAKPAPAPKPEQPRTELKGRKMSALDAAARILGETGQALTSKELIERMAAEGYWISPGGRTPGATLYVAI